MNLQWCLNGKFRAGNNSAGFNVAKIDVCDWYSHSKLIWAKKLACRPARCCGDFSIFRLNFQSEQAAAFSSAQHIPKKEHSYECKHHACSLCCARILPMGKHFAVHLLQGSKGRTIETSQIRQENSCPASGGAALAWSSSAIKQNRMILNGQKSQLLLVPLERLM